MANTNAGTSNQQDLDNRSTSNSMINSNNNEQPNVARNRKTAAQKAVLQEYWDKGMKSSGTEETQIMVEEVKMKTGLSKKTIQDWIGEKHRNERGRKRKRPFKPSTVTRKSSQSELQELHRVFRSDFMTGKDQSTAEKRSQLMKDVNAEWENVKAEESEMERLKELKVHTGGEDSEDLDDIERKSRVDAITAVITKMCIYMKEVCKYETLFMACDANKGQSATGSRLGLAHLHGNDNEAIRNFQYSVGARVQGGVPPSASEEEKTRMKKMVQSIFNDLYEKQTGKKQVEYKAIDEGRVKLTTTGFPNGLEFRRPWSYGEEDMSRLIEAAGSIQFIVERQENVGSTAGQEDGAVAQVQNGDGRNVERQENMGSAAGQEDAAVAQVQNGDGRNVERHVGREDDAMAVDDDDDGNDSNVSNMESDDTDRNDGQGDELQSDNQVSAWGLLSTIDREFLTEKNLRIKNPTLLINKLKGDDSKKKATKKKKPKRAGSSKKIKRSKASKKGGCQ